MMCVCAVTVKWENNIEIWLSRYGRFQYSAWCWTILSTTGARWMPCFAFQWLVDWGHCMLSGFPLYLCCPWCCLWLPGADYWVPQDVQHRQAMWKPFHFSLSSQYSSFTSDTNATFALYWCRIQFDVINYFAHHCFTFCKHCVFLTSLKNLHTLEHNYWSACSK